MIPTLNHVIKNQPPPLQSIKSINYCIKQTNLIHFSCQIHLELIKKFPQQFLIKISIVKF